jgi:hypothetical protein
MLVHATHLPQLLCVGLIVWVAARFAEELWGPEASVISAALLATSPALVLTGATFHNAIPTTLGTLVGLRAAFAANRLGRIRDCALAGAGFGGALLCRLLDAVAIGVPAALLMLVGVLRTPTDDPTRRRRLLGLGVGVLCALPFVAVLLASQRAVTGDMFLAPYSLMVRIWPNAHVFGFGNSAFGVMHTVQLALSKALVTWARLDAWSFGWPLALFVPILVVLGLGRDRVATWLLAAIGLKMAAYFFYVAPAVQTFGSYYNLPEVPLLAALTARAVLACRDRFHLADASLARLPLRMLAALTVTAFALFWPCQLAWLTRTGATINAPLDVAAEEARKGPVVVFYAQMQPPGLRETSWVFWPPLASGNLDEPVLWAANWGLHNLDLLKRMPERRPFLLTWDDGVPGLEPWTPELAPPGSERGPSRVEPVPVVGPPPSAMVLPEAYRWPVAPNKR